MTTSKQKTTATPSIKIKPLSKLLKHQQEEILEMYGKFIDSLEEFDIVTNKIEDFQVACVGDIKKSWAYIVEELLEKVELPYNLAYIIEQLKPNPKFIKKAELDLMQIIVKEYKFKGREQGLALHGVMKSFLDPLTVLFSLNKHQSDVASNQVTAENVLHERLTQLKVSKGEVGDKWAELNPEHPAVIRSLKEIEDKKTTESAV